MKNLGVVQTCGVIAVVCAAWNLFGDLYYMDFYNAYLSQEQFGKLLEQPPSRGNGYLFNFNENSFSGYVAQAGSWMYPIWAAATVLPLFQGLQQDGRRANDYPTGLIPCLLLFYGLCIVGGALHGSFIFLTISPRIFHRTDESLSQSTLAFANQCQTKIVQHIAVGTMPGFIACNIAAIWIAWLVQFRSTLFPRWFNLCNPVVTTIWAQTMGTILPDPWGFYFVGCTATWSILIWNLGACSVLHSKWHLQQASAQLGPLVSTDIAQPTKSYGSL